MNVLVLDDARRAALLANAKRTRLARGEAAYHPGDAADRVFVVAEGRVKIVRTSASGAESIVGIRIAGDLFGELTALDETTRATSAVAIAPSVVDVVAAEAFIAALRADPELGRAYARGIARRLTDAEDELVALLGKSVPGRLVDALGRLAADHGEPQENGTIRIGIDLTHQDLADLIGTSRETLTKELAVLADVGLLRVAHRTVTLVQPRAFPYRRRE